MHSTKAKNVFSSISILTYVDYHIKLFRYEGLSAHSSRGFTSVEAATLLSRESPSSDSSFLLPRSTFYHVVSLNDYLHLGIFFCKTKWYLPSFNWVVQVILYGVAGMITYMCEPTSLDIGFLAHESCPQRLRVKSPANISLFTSTFIIIIILYETSSISSISICLAISHINPTNSLATAAVTFGCGFPLCISLWYF